MKAPAGAADPDAFWSWACAAYARHGSSERLIALQDAHGANVNALLWSAWLASRGEALSPAAAARAAMAIEKVGARLTLPLREARRGAKTLAPALHDRLLALELEAERAEQATLVELGPGDAAGDRPGLAVENLAVMMRAMCEDAIGRDGAIHLESEQLAELIIGARRDVRND